MTLCRLEMLMKLPGCGEGSHSNNIEGLWSSRTARGWWSLKLYGNVLQSVGNMVDGRKKYNGSNQHFVGGTTGS